MRSHTGLLSILQALAYGVYARDTASYDDRIRAFRLKSLAAGAGPPDGITACLFDLDGVLTETAVVHARAWKTMFETTSRGTFDSPPITSPSSTASRARTGSAISWPRATSHLSEAERSATLGEAQEHARPAADLGDKVSRPIRLLGLLPARRLDKAGLARRGEGSSSHTARACARSGGNRRASSTCAWTAT